MRTPRIPPPTYPLCRLFLLALGAIAAARSAPSQTPDRTAAGDPAAAAATARAAWRRAVASTNAELADSVYADVQRAHRAWPMQPAYGEALARLAARRGDAPVLTRTLLTLAAQETGADLAADSAIIAVAARAPEIARALAALRSGVAPVENSRAREVSADTTFFPEGLDADPRDGTLYVTSLRHRNVLIVPRTGASRWLLDERVAGRAAITGVAIDTAHGVAWLSTAALPFMGRVPGDSALGSELLRVRLRDGAIVARHALGDGKGIPGELTLAPNGDLLVSDATLGQLYRLRAGANAVEVTGHRLLRSPQGIAITTDPHIAVIADWSHGLLRWDLRTDSITAIAVPEGAAVLGVDGLRRWGTHLIGVQNGLRPMRVIAMELDAGAHRAVRVRTLDRPRDARGEFTVGALVGDHFVYVASSAWPFWTDAGERNAAAGALPAVLVREVLLPPAHAP
jgi:hypothetical protein